MNKRVPFLICLGVEMPKPAAIEVLETLGRAFAFESRSAARNRTFAAKAEKENRPGPAALFLAAAMSQETRARRLLTLMRGKIGDTDQNLAEAFVSPAVEPYPDQNSEALSQAGKSIRNALSQGNDIQTTISAFYQNLTLDSGTAPDYLICQICGHVALDQAPERCPVCKAIKEKFLPAG